MLHYTDHKVEFNEGEFYKIDNISKLHDAHLQVKNEKLNILKQKDKEISPLIKFSAGELLYNRVIDKKENKQQPEKVNLPQGRFEVFQKLNQRENFTEKKEPLSNLTKMTDTLLKPSKFKKDEKDLLNKKEKFDPNSLNTQTKLSSLKAYISTNLPKYQ